MRPARLALLAFVLTALVTLGGPAARSQDPSRPVVGAVRTTEDNDRIHAFVVMDTDDDLLQEDLKADLARLNEVLKGGLTALGKDISRPDLLNWQVFAGADVRAAKILGAIEKAPVGPRDTVLFFYGGHGDLDPAGGHFMPLSSGEKLYRSQLLDAIRARNPRLTIVITDSCAPVVTEKPGLTYGVAPRTAAPVPNLRMLRGLFLQHVGVVDINSCAPGEKAWGYNGVPAGKGPDDKPLPMKKGGIFTQKFCDEMFTSSDVIDADKDTRVSWDEFFEYLQPRVAKDFGGVRSRVLDVRKEHEIKDQTTQTLWTNSLVKNVRVGLRASTDPASKQVKVEEVFEGRPAEKAGLKPGDVIVSVDGKPVTDDRELGLAIDLHPKKAGPIKLRVKGGSGGERDVEVTPAY